MKKLFGNRFALISYLVIILSFFLLLILSYIDNQLFGQYLSMSIPIYLVLFFIWSIYIATLKKNAPIKDKQGLILLIIFPIILLFVVIFYNEISSNFSLLFLIFPIYITLIFVIIPIGILNHRRFLSIIIWLLIIGLFFKSSNIAGANYISMSVAPLFLVNMIYELFLTRKVQNGKKDFIRLFILQSLAYISLFGSLWIFIGELNDIIIGQLMVALV